MGKNLAIITARGGSKRIPRKNIRDFCGKPIIAYSIEAAIQSGVFDEVMVSTDDEEIADIACKYGAVVPFMRSCKNSDDYATTTDVLLEVLEEYSRRNCKFDYFSCIYPTAPFVTGDILRDAFHKLKDSGAKTLVPVVSYSFPLQRSFSIVNDRIKVNCPQFINCRSQDLEKMYHDAGQFYMADTEYFLNEHKVFSSDAFPYILTELQVQDIDTMIDWKLAEIKYRLLQGEQNV